ncbi:hypothetical protein Glove_149g54 [Diversispora epigaea]|uniref:Uncharacterized protein n=1 Tax=Diversispora epigaea TaxID=1348612 RepID=A0A397J339_9GLOM|nr:hypothetical protein Glove_149g54 [Diversispora epigaea]
MAGKPSETQADITVVFQPEALSLNYLRNQEITTIPGERELPITNDSDGKSNAQFFSHGSYKAMCDL